MCLMIVAACKNKIYGKHYRKGKQHILRVFGFHGVAVAECKPFLAYVRNASVGAGDFVLVA